MGNRAQIKAKHQQSRINQCYKKNKHLILGLYRAVRSDHAVHIGAKCYDVA